MESGFKWRVIKFSKPVSFKGTVYTHKYDENNNLIDTEKTNGTIRFEKDELIECKMEDSSTNNLMSLEAFVETERGTFYLPVESDSYTFIR